MLKVLLTGLMVLAATTAQAEIVSKSFEVDKFTGLNAGGSLDVAIAVGEEQKVMAFSNEETLARIEMSVVNDNLHVDLRSSSSWFSDDDEDIRLVIYVKELRYLDLGGSVDLEVKGIAGKSLEIELAGSVEADLAGTIDNLVLDIAGSGEVTAQKLKAKNVKVDIAGSGEVDLNVSESIEAKIAGSGEINYVGNPTKVNTRVAGSGEIKKKG